jgi:hypothetical protein
VVRQKAGKEAKQASGRQLNQAAWNAADGRMAGSFEIVFLRQKLNYSSFVLIEDESAAVLIVSLNGKK